MISGLSDVSFFPRSTMFIFGDPALLQRMQGNHVVRWKSYFYKFRKLRNRRDMQMMERTRGNRNKKNGVGQHVLKILNMGTTSWNLNKSLKMVDDLGLLINLNEAWTIKILESQKIFNNYGTS